MVTDPVEYAQLMGISVRRRPDLPGGLLFHTNPTSLIYANDRLRSVRHYRIWLGLAHILALRLGWSLTEVQLSLTAMNLCSRRPSSPAFFASGLRIAKVVRYDQVRKPAVAS